MAMTWPLRNVPSHSSTCHCPGHCRPCCASTRSTSTRSCGGRQRSHVFTLTGLWRSSWRRGVERAFMRHPLHWNETETVKRCSPLRLTENSGCRKSIALGCSSFSFRRARSLQGTLGRLPCRIRAEKPPVSRSQLLQRVCSRSCSRRGATCHWVRVVVHGQRTGKAFF